MEIEDKAQRLARLIEDKLDIGGRGLSAKLARAGKLLPRHVREEAGYIARAAQMQGHPRLAAQIDQRRVRRGYRRCVRYLRAVNEWERRRWAVIDWAAGNVMSLLILGLIFFAYAGYRVLQ